jgi:hypothetical protein
MYGLPPDFDFTVFAGRRLEQICFAEYQINLHFDGEVGIGVESTFSYDSGRRQPTQVVEVPVTTSDLMGLLGHQVSEAREEKAGTLVLVFDNDHTLRIFDDSREYESYRVWVGQKEIIV